MRAKLNERKFKTDHEYQNFQPDRIDYFNGNTRLNSKFSIKIWFWIGICAWNECDALLKQLNEPRSKRQSWYTKRSISKEFNSNKTFSCWRCSIDWHWWRSLSAATFCGFLTRNILTHVQIPFSYVEEL